MATQRLSLDERIWATARREAFDRGISASRLVELAIIAFLDIPEEGGGHRPGVAIVPNDRPAERDPRMTLRDGNWVPEAEVGKELRRIGTQIGIDPAVPGGDRTADVRLDAVSIVKDPLPGMEFRGVDGGPLPWDRPKAVETSAPPAEPIDTSSAAGIAAQLRANMVISDPEEAAKAVADLTSKNGRAVTPVTKESQTGRTRKPRR